ncbi:hypothetical protein [Roseibium sp.]|uniref:hypothetical protein n=1 Tax=Roseibium sp. TaxID=1936156 RepID=UPI003A979FB1
MTGWKTLLFNSVLSLLAIGAEVAEQLALVEPGAVLPAGGGPLAVLAMGAANILLRHVTRGPAGWSRQRFRHAG